MKKSSNRYPTERRAKTLSILSKVLTLGFILLIDWDAAIHLFQFANALPFVMFIENTVFISSISPLAVFSIILADNALLGENYLILLLGYLGALAGNFTSFRLGKFVSTTDREHQITFRETFATFWHPQLGALLAFEKGAQGVDICEYFKKAIPVSAFYYFIALVLISYIDLSAVSNDETGITLLCGVLVVWILLDLRKFLGRG